MPIEFRSHFLMQNEKQENAESKNLGKKQRWWGTMRRAYICVDEICVKVKHKAAG